MNREKETDERFMRMALEEARKAGKEGEVPVGAVLVSGEDVLARAGNGPIALNDPTAHAEIRAIRSAAAQMGNYRLPGTTLYATLEPCIMCAGAILNARIPEVYYGASDTHFGACGGVMNLFEEAFPHKVRLIGGLLAQKSTALLGAFFEKLR